VVENIVIATPALNSVLVHIVSYNHADVLAPALTALARTRGITYEIRITDNASSDLSSEVARRFHITPTVLPRNIGFCGGHNSIIAEFIASSHQFLCLLNPDVALSETCLAELAAHCSDMATPKLLRGDASLHAIKPARIDAAGMILTAALRHFDRGSQQLDCELFSRPAKVFGGTGACLMLSKKTVNALILPDTPFDDSLELIHQGLAEASCKRMKLFDEGFFAYRDDAELAWRAQRLGLVCQYVPTALAVHKRAVLPENRSELPAFINYLSVRNRFLLQLNHFSFAYTAAILPGFLFRNILVIFATLLKERSSLRAFKDLFALRKRAFFLRNWITANSALPDAKVARWLTQESE